MPLKIWYQSGVDFDHHPGYRKALDTRFEIDRVPLIDATAASVLLAEFAVAMAQRAGLEASRRFAYARPSAAALAALSGSL